MFLKKVGDLIRLGPGEYVYNSLGSNFLDYDDNKVTLFPQDTILTIIDYNKEICWTKTVPRYKLLYNNKIYLAFHDQIGRARKVDVVKDVKC
jgi:hypothetical protein